ncbi:MAG: hypothetical protein Q9186_003285 [Xanthomendoza sp. 1 TL-2023]
MGLTLGPMGSSLSLRIWTLLILLSSSVTFAASAFTLSKPYYVSRNPPILMVNETGPLFTNAGGNPKPVEPKDPHSFGIEIHPGTVPILPQAVGGILSQALYKAFLELGPEPLRTTNNFEHAYSESFFSRVCFDVAVSMTATETTPGRYMLTNTRIATVLSLMGFDFSHQDQLSDLREYHFDIVVEEKQNRTIIGRGTLRNTDPVHVPTRGRSNRLMVASRCYL